MASPSVLELGTLFLGRPGLTPSEGGVLAGCAVVCLEAAGRSVLAVLRGRDGVGYSLVVPKSRMPSVVCPYWEHLVRATGQRQGKSIVLDEIPAASADV